MEELKKVKCEWCGQIYDYIDEPKEVKEMGINVCENCWEEGQKEKKDTLEFFDNLKKKKVKCEACGNMYEYIDEPQEVKEGGTYICPDCWAKEEGE